MCNKLTVPLLLPFPPQALNTEPRSDTAAVLDRRIEDPHEAAAAAATAALGDRSASAGWFGGLFQRPAAADMVQVQRAADTAGPLGSALRQPPARLAVPRSRSDAEEFQVAVVRSLVQQYFDIVRRNMQASWGREGRTANCGVVTSLCLNVREQPAVHQVINCTFYPGLAALRVWL